MQRRGQRGSASPTGSAEATEGSAPSRPPPMCEATWGGALLLRHVRANGSKRAEPNKRFKNNHGPRTCGAVQSV